MSSIVTLFAESEVKIMYMYKKKLTNHSVGIKINAVYICAVHLGRKGPAIMSSSARSTLSFSGADL